MLTAAAVAAQLGISKRAVYDLAARGALPSSRDGRAIRFEQADIDRFKASSRIEGPRPPKPGATPEQLRAAIQKIGRRRR